MKHEKPGLRMLAVLAGLVLSMMISAAAAQAASPEYFVNGTLVSPTLDPTLSGVQEGPMVILLLFFGYEVRCEKAEVTKGLVASNSLAELSLLYKECAAYRTFGLELDPECVVSDVVGKNPSKLHITVNGLKLLPIEFASGDFGVLIHVNMIINFLSGTKCPLPVKSELKGTTCALIGAGTNETVEPLFLLNQAIQESCADKLSFSGQPAAIDSAFKLFLADDEHRMRTLGILLA